MPAFVYWLAGALAIQGAADAPTIGDIVAFTTLQSRLFFPLGQLLNVQVEIQGALALFDRIFEYLDLDPEIVDAPDAVALEPRDVRGHVRFRHVCFRYPVAGRSPAPARTAEAATADRPERRAAPTRSEPVRRSSDVDFEARPGAARRPGRPFGRRARRRPPTCCRASTTSTRARSRSTASTSRGSRSSRSGG